MTRAATDPVTAEVIEVFDVDSMRGMSFALFPVDAADPDRGAVVGTDELRDLVVQDAHARGL